MSSYDRDRLVKAAAEARTMWEAHDDGVVTLTGSELRGVSRMILALQLSAPGEKSSAALIDEMNSTLFQRLGGAGVIAASELAVVHERVTRIEREQPEGGVR